MEFHIWINLYIFLVVFLIFLKKNVFRIITVKLIKAAAILLQCSHDFSVTLRWVGYGLLVEKDMVCEL